MGWWSEKVLYYRRFDNIEDTQSKKVLAKIKNLEKDGKLLYKNGFVFDESCEKFSLVKSKGLNLLLRSESGQTKEVYVNEKFLSDFRIIN